MTLTKKVYHEVLNNPGMTLPELTSRLKEISPKAIAEILHRLAKNGTIVKKGLRGHYEYCPSNIAVVAKALVDEHCGIAHPNPVSAFTPRELLEELKRRGYVWDKMWFEERKYVEYSKI